MMDSVATFPARQCHGKGIKREIAARKAMGANSGRMTDADVGGERGRMKQRLAVFEALL